MIRHFVPVAMLLMIAPACSSSTTTDAGTAATATTIPSDTLDESTTTTPTSTTVVRTTVSPPTTVACHFVDGGRGTNLFRGDCDTPGGQETVRLLQRLLGDAGFPVAQSGLFDAATEAAVKAFQSANGLEVDGQVGPLTWGALPDTDVEPE